MTGPLSGIRVVEFSHMVMGPSCGLVLGDLGAEVVKVEPIPQGDNTRRLVGAGAGFFAAFNRNKKSLVLDLKTDKGVAFAKKLIGHSDVLTENFRPGGLDALGLGYEALKEDHPGLIYCSLKGFLAGPYENRAALDEVVQMMGGLAYMTGPPGRPLRAGTSVNDIMGGMFARSAFSRRCTNAPAPEKASWCAARFSRTTCSSSRSTWRNLPSPENRPRPCRRG